MTWDRTVRGQVTIHFQMRVSADTEEVARQEALRYLRERYGYTAHVNINSLEVTPAGDWCGACVGTCTGVHTEGEERGT